MKSPVSIYGMGNGNGRARNVNALVFNGQPTQLAPWFVRGETLDATWTNACSNIIVPGEQGVLLTGQQANVHAGNFSDYTQWLYCVPTTTPIHLSMNPQTYITGVPTVVVLGQTVPQGWSASMISQYLADYATLIAFIRGLGYTVHGVRCVPNPVGPNDSEMGFLGYNDTTSLNNYIAAGFTQTKFANALQQFVTGILLNGIPRMSLAYANPATTCLPIDDYGNILPAQNPNQEIYYLQGAMAASGALGKVHHGFLNLGLHNVDATAPLAIQTTGNYWFGQMHVSNAQNPLLSPEWFVTAQENADVQIVAQQATWIELHQNECQVPPPVVSFTTGVG